MLPRGVRRPWLLALVLAALPAPAAAHVEASPDRNNRYLKLTPMSDRLRLSYTILIGAAPAAVARQALDTDRSGQLSDAEADVWGRDVASKVASELEIEIDGVVVPVAWTEVFVGLETPAVNAGSFSLDLIAWICAPTGPGGHEVELRDRFAINPAGETEVLVEGHPGVQIASVAIDGHALPDRQASFQGSATPLADGLRLVYRSDDPALDDERCPLAAARKRDDHPRWPWVVGGLVALVMVVSLGLARRQVASVKN